MSNRFKSFHRLAMQFWLILIIFTVQSFTATGQDLIKGSEEQVAYKLSNYRDGTGFTGDAFSFDYRRTREGEGFARVVIETNEGEMRILGGPIRIEESGTINLRNLLGRASSILNPNEQDGIAIYFVVDGTGRDRYLVSNIIRSGAPKVKVQSRAMTESEQAELEQRRIARLPPAEEPSGHVRSNNATKLVGGVPLLFGAAGKWEKGTAVDFPSGGLVRVLPDGEDRVRVVKIAEWTAIAEGDLKKLNSNPSQFRNRVRTLSGGNLVLNEDQQPLGEADALAIGTPLYREKNGKWEQVFFLSADRASVRILYGQQGARQTEFTSRDQLVIEQQVLRAQKDQNASKKYAQNVSGFEKELMGGQGLRKPASGLAGGGLSTRSQLPRISQPPNTNQTLPPAQSTAMESKSATSTKAISRIWRDQTGAFEIEAMLIEDDGDQVKLKRTDQKIISVPFAALSKDDQSYLADLRDKPQNPFENVISEVNSQQPDYGRPLKTRWTIDNLTWGAKSLAISPDNHFLMIGRKAASATLIDLASGKTVVDSGRMNEMGDIGVCCFTPDGKRLILGGNNGLFQLYALNPDQSIEMLGQHRMHNREITSLCVSPDGSFALSGDSDKVARYWNVNTAEPIATLDGFDGKIKATRISPDGDRLIATDGKTLSIYSVKQDKTVTSLQVGKSHASGQAAAISQNAKHLAVGDGYKIEIWNLESNQKMGVLEGSEISWSMHFTPDDRFLLCGGNGCIHAWDVETMSKVQTTQIGKSFYVQAIAISHDGTLVSSPSAFSEVVVLNATP